MMWVALTRAQGGLVARTQLRAGGLSDAEIDSLVRSGRLELTKITAVYRAGGAPFTTETPAWLAVLGTRSPLSFISAAHWWEIETPPDQYVHITRYDRTRLDWPAGVRVHRVDLRPGDVVSHRGLLITNRTETVLDCMGWLPFGRARELGDRACQQRWIAPTDVERRLITRPGRWGNRQLRRLLDHLGDGAAAQSERLLHTLLRDAGVGGWKPNWPVICGGSRYVIDLAFPELRIAIEVDGYRYHEKGSRFQQDRTKQNALSAAGWRILRFTWADLTERPFDVIAQITQLLAA